MVQKTHFNEETLVRYLRAALQHLHLHAAVDLAHVYGADGVMAYNMADALRDLNEQFPELTAKEKKFLDVIRATQPELLSHAKELILLKAEQPVPSHLVTVNRAYAMYLSTLTHWGV